MLRNEKKRTKIEFFDCCSSHQISHKMARKSLSSLSHPLSPSKRAVSGRPKTMNLYGLAQTRVEEAIKIQMGGEISPRSRRYAVALVQLRHQYAFDLLLSLSLMHRTKQSLCLSLSLVGQTLSASGDHLKACPRSLPSLISLSSSSLHKHTDMGCGPVGSTEGRS